MCWGIQDLLFVEEIFKGAQSLVVRNDCIQRFDVHSEEETMFSPEAKRVQYQYSQHVAILVDRSSRPTNSRHQKRCSEGGKKIRGYRASLLGRVI